MDQDKLELVVNGQKKIYDVYYSFTCPQTNRGYIVYTEHEIDSEGREVLLYKYYDPNKSTKELFPVTDPKEIELIKSVYEKIKNIA